MKTAVEWLVDTINKINHDYEVGIIDEPLWSIQTYEAHKQAKEMEKEQMCKFASDYVETQCNASFDGSVSVEITTEEYYNLTFKSE
jgi:hypothetical protein